MYIIVVQNVNILTILIFTKYFLLFLISNSGYYDGFTIVKDREGNNKVTDYTPYHEAENLLPTADFLRRHSQKEVEKYNQEMKERKNRH